MYVEQDLFTRMNKTFKSMSRFNTNCYIRRFSADVYQMRTALFLLFIQTDFFFLPARYHSISYLRVGARLLVKLLTCIQGLNPALKLGISQLPYTRGQMSLQPSLILYMKIGVESSILSTYGATVYSYKPNYSIRTTLF